MHYVLLIGAFIMFVFTAPAKTIAAVCALALAITWVVKASTQAVVGTSPTYGEAFKAVGLALVFLVIAQLTLASFSIGTGISQFVGVPGAAVSLGMLASYVAGFSIALGTTFFPSVLIALISTVASVLALWATASIL